MSIASFITGNDFISSSLTRVVVAVFDSTHFRAAITYFNRVCEYACVSHFGFLSSMSSTLTWPFIKPYNSEYTTHIQRNITSRGKRLIMACQANVNEAHAHESPQMYVLVCNRPPYNHRSVVRNQIPFINSLSVRKEWLHSAALKDKSRSVGQR